MRHQRSFHVRFEGCEPYNVGTHSSPMLMSVDVVSIMEPLHVHEPFLQQDFLWLLAQYGSTS